MNRIVTIITLSFLLLSACSKKGEDRAEPMVFSARGDINTTLSEFRARLGTLNTSTGVSGGRREINWDGVPDAMTGIRLPADFFNPTGPGAALSLQRGLVYAGNDSAMVSKTAFAEINGDASSEFSAFSGNKQFAVINSNFWPVEFRVAGTNTPAGINAFGIVFVDVDKENSTFIEFFSADGSLGKYYAPTHNSISKFSFIGVYFPNQKISYVKVGHEARLSSGLKDISQGGTLDLVALDDFIYSEPEGY